MHKKVGRLGIVGFGLIYTLVSINAEEVVSDSVMEIELNPYVMVATRTPVPLNQVSPSVSYISANAIADNQDRSVVNLLEREPGIVLNTNGVKGGLTSLFMRGTESNHTGFFLDGRRLNPGFANQFDLEFLAVDNLSSVEVQRGPSSVNYGAAGIGGVVSLQTRSDLGEKVRLIKTETELGSYDSYRGILSASFADESKAISIGMSGLTTENKRSNDDFDMLNLNSRIDYKLTPLLTAELIALINESDKGLSNTVDTPSDTDFSKTDSWLVSPGIHYESENWTGNVFYSRTRQVLNSELTFLGASFDNKSLVESDELYTQINYSGVEKTLISFGALYRNDKASDESLSFLEHFEQAGLWGHIQLKLSDTLAVRLGARYDEYTDFDSALNGNIEALYAFAHTGTTLFAKLASAYAPPSAQDIAFDSDPVGTSLNPEESDAYETGVRQVLIDDTLQLSAVVFRNEIDNLISFVGLDAFNTNEATTEGAELSARYRPAEILDLNVAYTYLTALDNKTDKRLPRRPRHIFQASAWLKPVDSWKLGLRATGYFDREDVIFGPAPNFARLQVDQEDFFLLDLLFDYTMTKNISVFVRVENLLDETYESVIGYPALGRTGYLGYRWSF